MTSPPRQLEDPMKATLELAIKCSSHLPTEWMTSKVSTRTVSVKKSLSPKNKCEWEICMA